MDRDHILNNIDDYTAEQLFEAVNSGIVSLQELQRTGELPASKRSAIKALLQQEQSMNGTHLNVDENQEMNRGHILNHVEDIPAEQLFEAIKCGEVTLKELQETGNLTASKRTAINSLIRQEEAKDLAEWNSAKNLNTEESYQQYLEKYQFGRYCTDANKALTILLQKKKEAEGELKRIMAALQANHNAYPAATIRKYLNEGKISRKSLVEIGIPDRIIDKLYNYQAPQEWKLGETPASIPKGYKEVYFWGIRGSGKTTALAAVLSTADKLGFLEIAQGPGYNYMLQLQNLFSTDIAILPAASPVDNTQYLPFTLKKPNENNHRSISLIELSGEIFQCFLYKNASKPLPTQQHQETFDSLLEFLKGDNRKLHFFFVDYDKANKVDQDGYTQANYLNAAATFFNNPKYNIFSKSTDAIYIVTTKSDLMPQDSGTDVEQIKNYLYEANFNSFVNSLKAKCKEHSINNKRLLATPFSLGSVYFTEVCEFDDRTAKNIIDILMRRIPKRQNNILDVFNK